MDHDDFGDESEDLESTVDVMKDYLEEESSSCSETKDIFDECDSDSNDAMEKPNRKKFVWASHIKIIDDKSLPCYQCTFCNSYFSHSNTARNHEFCGSGKKPYKCKLCDKRFVKKYDRDNHYRIHTGERPFECSLCKKTFQLKHKLSRHIRSHTGIKGDYKCSTCQRSFICKEALRKHEVSKHTSNKATKCKTCKMIFGKSKERFKHKCSKKASRKKLVCEICGKTFSRNWNLVVHQGIHKGQRPYECSICGKCFRLRQHMERHSAKHQPDADFECTLCNRTFGRKDNMIRHLKLTHPDRHLGVDLNEIVKQAEKVKSDKTKMPFVEGATKNSTSEPYMVPTIITVDNLPNIRFAKMPPGHSNKKIIEKVPGSTKGNKGSNDVECMKTTDCSVSVDVSKPVNDAESGYKSTSTVYATRTSRSVVMKTVVQSGEHQMAQQMTSRIVQQSSVICLNASAIASRSNHIDNQPGFTVPGSHENGSPVIQSTIFTQEATSQLQNNTSYVSESQRRYLPVSVLSFKSSGELRMAVPKNITSNSLTSTVKTNNVVGENPTTDCSD